MPAFDALVCNTDRHLTNFGVLRDSATGAPIGLTLLPNVAEDDASQFELESQPRGLACGGPSFDELLEYARLWVALQLLLE